MTRAHWKSFYIDAPLLRQFFAILKKPSNLRPVLPVYSRASTILPDFVGLKVMIHNGIRFTTITINKLMVGRKFGEFAYPKRMGMSIHKVSKIAGVKSKIKKSKKH